MANRKALLIGNGAYGGAAVKAPPRNVDALLPAVQGVGFEAVGRHDLGLSAMQTELADFADRLERDDIALFFYSGHGVQAQGQSYLVPVDAASLDEPALPNVCLPLRGVFDVLSRRETGVSIVIADTCQNAEGPPVPHGAGVQAGQARPQEQPRETFVAFSAKPGTTAADQPLGPTLFTAALIHHLSTPGLSLDDWLARVSETLIAVSSQEAWRASTLTAPFYLRPPAVVMVSIEDADDDAFVFVNGEQVSGFKARGLQPVPVVLQPGENDVRVKVFNQKTFRGGVPWGPPEGWRYRVKLTLPDGRLVWNWAEGEDRPPRDGARHGGVFDVARVRLHVGAGAGDVSVLRAETDLWRLAG